jgi:hypothetical protein
MSRAASWLPAHLEQRLRALGFVDLCDLTSDLSEQRLREVAGEPITTARTRRLYRLAGGNAETLFIKLQIARPGNLPLRKWLSYLCKGPSVRREAKAIQQLKRIGVRTQDLLAAGMRVSLLGTVRAALIVRELPGYTDLATALKNGLAVPAARSSIAAVEAVVADLHARGLGLNGACYRDFLIPRVGAEKATDVVVIDPAGLGGGARRRRRDLQQLAAQRHGGCHPHSV